MKTIAMKLLFALSLIGFSASVSTVFANEEKKADKKAEKSDKKGDKKDKEAEAPKGGW